MTSKEPFMTNDSQAIKKCKVKFKIKKLLGKRCQHIYEGKDKIILGLSSAILKAWKRVEQYISSLKNK